MKDSRMTGRGQTLSTEVDAGPEKREKICVWSARIDIRVEPEGDRI